MKKVKSKHKLKKVSNEKIQEKFDEIEAKEITKSPSKMVIERGLISKLLETEDFNTYKDKQLKSYYFGEDTKPMISYIEKYYMKHGSLPTLRVFRKKFPDFELETYKSKEVGTKEPLTYWCDELRLKVTHNTLCDGVEKAGELLDETQTENALTLIKQLVLKVQGDYSESTAIDITKDKEDRLEVYKQRKLNKGMIGIPMGIDKLDMLLKGMQPKQLITLIARPGVGKANPLSTPVLTPQGFIPMGDVQVGTLVIGEDGRQYPVTAIHPQGVKDIYELTFDDGTKSRCSKEHLWKFKTMDDLARDNEWRVDTLENMMKLPIKRRGRCNMVIPVNEPVDFETQLPLPLDPYVLGVLLGDGGFTTDRISLSNPEKDIVDGCNLLLRNWGEFKYHKGTNCQYEFKRAEGLTKNILYKTIQDLGLQGKGSKDKFIPKQYLHASISDRHDLLMGLFDTDGHVSEKGSYSISTYSYQLRDDIMYLCRSLGYRCRLSTYDRTSTNKGVEYRIRILTHNIIFSSIKHQSRYDKVSPTLMKRNYKVQRIVSIEKVGQEECQCISVDSEDHTYICDDFIVTHNTWFLILVACYCQLQGYRVLFFTTEMSEEQIEDRMEAVLIGMMYGEFNYGKFKSGSLSDTQEEIYMSFLERKEKLEPLIVESATGVGVSTISAKITEYKPDVIFVDSAYLMEDDRSSTDQDWLRVAHITRDLKQIAKNMKLPIFINSQADSTTSKKTGPELDNIGFSSAIGQDSDVVMALFRDEEMIEDKEIKAKILKQREGVMGNVLLNWDFNTMNFKAIYSETPTGESLDKAETEHKNNYVEI